jgi:protein-tyrosine phosphatase
LIDLHSHLLPDIDDGSRSVTQSVLVLKQFAEDGITDVVLTPHVAAGELAFDKEDALERREVAFTLLSRDAPPTPRLHLGFEIMLDVPLAAGILEDRRFSLAGSRYYLVEFPISVAEDDATSLVEGLVGGDAVPLIAHAERYRYCSIKSVARWKQLGAKIQVDATTLTRTSYRGRIARQLLSAGLADVVAADNHGDDRVLGSAVRFLSNHESAHIARSLDESNPKAVLENRDMSMVPAAKFREGLWSRIKHYMES